MTGRPHTLLAMSEVTFGQLFDEARLKRLYGTAELGVPLCIGEVRSAAARARLREAEVLLTGWGCPPLTEAVLAGAPNLRAVLHAAGTVKGLLPDEASWRRDLLVTSAAEANSIPVAEFTLAAILLAGKRVPGFAAAYRRHAGEKEAWRHQMPLASNYGRTVGIIGLSRIGRRVASLLRGFDFRVLAYDPYAAAAEARELGASLVPLKALLCRSDIVTLHAPELPSTRHMLDSEGLALLPDQATVINTARGSLLDTAALTAECASGRLSAVLDVTDPEPLPAASPLYTLPNVLLTPHIAGATDTEVGRLADAALAELERYAAGLPPRHPIVAADLARIA